MNFETFLLEKGYKDYYFNPKTRIKEKFNYYSTMGHLIRTFEKDGKLIYYGLSLHGLPPYILYAHSGIISMINVVESEFIENDKIMQRIEIQFDFDLIEDVIINKNGYFQYDYKTDNIKYIK